MTNKSWWYGGGSGVIVIALLWGGLAYYDREPAPLPVPEKSSGAAMEIEGLKFSNYLGGRLQSRVTAAQLVVIPRKIGIFQVQSINEALISRFRLEMHNPPLATGEKSSGGALPEELSAGIKGLAALKGAGRIVKVTIAGLEILSWRGETSEFYLQARSGSFDARHQRLELEKVIIEQPGNPLRLTTDVAVWNPELKAFAVPGPYLLYRGKEVIKGEKIYVDLAFRLIHPPANGKKG